MKLDSEARPNDDEKQLIEHEWDQRLQNFFLREFGFDSRKLGEYEAAKEQSFKALDVISLSVEGEVSRIFGNCLQLIYGEKLAKIRDDSRSTFEQKLQGVLGKSALEQYETLKDQFGEWVYDKFEVGWNDVR